MLYILNNWIVRNKFSILFEIINYLFIIKILRIVIIIRLMQSRQYTFQKLYKNTDNRQINFLGYS